LKKFPPSLAVYILPLLITLMIAFWQRAEHQRVRENHRQSLITRSRDISTSLAIVMQSQRRFGGFVARTRLESALEGLLQTHELRAVMLLNRSLDVVAEAGLVEGIDTEEVIEEGVRWDRNKVSFFNLVDLGAGISTNVPSGPAIVMDPPEGTPGDGSRRRFRIRRPETEDPEGNADVEEPATPDAPDEPPPPRFSRPPWMDSENYQRLQEQQGVHGFVIEMSSAAMSAAIQQDFKNRTIIVIFAGLAAFSGAFAWRYVSRNSEVELRLIRTSEQNIHLREMNMAAAGLAHETRNPLNLIRGKAQMISSLQDAPEEIRTQCGEIATEVDRVTSQLNEFINYSKPRDVKRMPIRLTQVFEDILRTLKPDMDDQGVELHWKKQDVEIEADEKMLRQVLFNLLLNALQVQEDGGAIHIRTGQLENGSIYIEIADEGPGIDPELRDSVFEPYVTAREGGTGLGLAIVKQIILAHGWEIRCLPSEKGACFRTAQIKSTSHS